MTRKKETLREDIDPGSTLAIRHNIKELVAIYQQADADIRKGFALIKAAEDSLENTFTSRRGLSFEVRPLHGRGALNFSRPDEALVDLQRRIWQSLIERLELRRFMSVKAWEDLEKQITKGEVLPITEENLFAMADQFRKALPEMLEQAIVEVYDYLRSRRNVYKTNSQYKVGRKVILEWIIDPTFSRHWHVHLESQPYLTALENVFTALDGKGQITSNQYSDLGLAINELPKAETVGETEYFRFKCYKKGTLHLEFKKMDLVHEFNRRAGKSLLKNAA